MVRFMLNLGNKKPLRLKLFGSSVIRRNFPGWETEVFSMKKVYVRSIPRKTR